MREFKATCQKVTVLPDGLRGCVFETTDTAAYVAHMKQVHETKLGTLFSPDLQRPVAWKPALPAKPWKAPRAKELFEAKPGQPGAEITFEYDLQTLTGQVWSLASGGVWVVTEDQAIYGVKLPKNGRPYVFQRYPSPAERAAEQEKQEAEAAKRAATLCVWPGCDATAAYNVVSPSPHADHRLACNQHVDQLTDTELGQWSQRRAS